MTYGHKRQNIRQGVACPVVTLIHISGILIILLNECLLVADFVSDYVGEQNRYINVHKVDGRCSNDCYHRGAFHSAINPDFHSLS
jgi:hypothetical protein